MPALEAPVSSPRLYLASTVLVCLFLFHLLALLVLLPALSNHGSLVEALPPVIKVGGIFARDECEQAAVFRYAIEKINREQVLPGTRLEANVVQFDLNDSFHGHKYVCSLLENGTIALFGPMGGKVYMHVQSISDSLEIPHIECHWNSKSGHSRNQLSVNMYPKFELISAAFIDIVRAWKWKTFVIIYEANEGLIRVQDFLKESEKYSWTIQLYQVPANHSFRELFWEIKKQKINNLLLDLTRESLHTSLQHAQQVGMMTSKQNFLITSLDLYRVNLENFQYSTARITALHLVDLQSAELREVLAHLADLRSRRCLLTSPDARAAPDSTVLPNNILTESALLYDAVHLFARALGELDQGQSISMPQLHTPCYVMKPWLYGTSLMNYMRQITFRGITGLVGFDQLGKRIDFQLDVASITKQGLKTIGSWNRTRPKYERLQINKEWQSVFHTATLQNKTLIVTTILNSPYTMLIDSSKERLGNSRFEGYIVDLVEELSKILGFKYIFKLVGDNKHGTNEGGVWNGLIGELVNKKADIAVGDLTITSKRAEAVDFTLPFMNTGISILFKKPTTKVTTLFSFLSPLSPEVWFYVLAAYVGVSSVLFLVGRISPYEWENPNPCHQDDDMLRNNFSLINSFFFTIGSMMQQGSALAPKAMSTRTIAGLWYFFTLIMISSYTANLAAFLTVERVIFPIKDAEDLAKQSQIEYGCFGGGSTYTFFRDSNISTFQRMFQFMKSRPHVFMDGNDEGKKRVEKGGYAYLMESASIEYIVERNCNLTKIGENLDTKGYGIATRKKSHYRNLLSEAILLLQETGRLQYLKDKWWKQKKGGGACIEDSKKSSSRVTALKIDNVGGIFVVLIGGLSFSFLVAIFEFMYYSHYNKSCDNICEDLVSDLKFSLKCSRKAKPNPRPRCPVGSMSSMGSYQVNQVGEPPFPAGYFSPQQLLSSNSSGNNLQNLQHHHHELQEIPPMEREYHTARHRHSVAQMEISSVEQIELAYEPHRSLRLYPTQE